jgi:hypothetical protein
MIPPGALFELTRQLLSVSVPGAAVEIGCHQGWTTCFLVEALMEKGINRKYVCIDTFNGFNPKDTEFEYRVRTKAVGLYDNFFVITDPSWLKASLSQFGYFNATVRKTDATTFDYRTLGPIAFAFVDVDLYRPVRESVKRVRPNMVPGGVILIDDCDPTNGYWDGAYQAYTEACEEYSIKPEILCERFGVIHT